MAVTKAALYRQSAWYMRSGKNSVRFRLELCAAENNMAQIESAEVDFPIPALLIYPKGGFDCCLRNMTCNLKRLLL